MNSIYELNLFSDTKKALREESFFNHSLSL